MTTSPLVATTDLSEEQILERATVCARGMQRAGAELLVLAYEWAVAHPADRLDPKEAGKPGRERATILGGPGTPEVTEFAAAEFGARIGRTSHHGRKLMAGALDLRIRLPLLWGRVQALEVRDSYALYVAERTRELSVEEAGWVDQEVAEAADGRIPWTHFEALVAGKVAAAAPQLAKEKEERAAAATYARTIRPRAGDETHGIGTFVVHGPLPVIEALDTAEAVLADRRFHPELWVELARRVEHGELGNAIFASKLVEVAGVSLEIGERHAPAAIEHLRAAADTTNLEATHAALLAASNRQLQGLAATERLLELLAEWDNFQSVLSLTRDILNRQKNLLERTRQYAKEH